MITEVIKIGPRKFQENKILTEKNHVFESLLFFVKNQIPGKNWFSQQDPPKLSLRVAHALMGISVTVDEMIPLTLIY